ncbi:MAG TPA: PilZ domain-containing protein [Candidatus Brocadiia bacterium]|nr:PilZ domain-containing protein [Candidatus Brocadiia bacterium]
MQSASEEPKSGAERRQATRFPTVGIGLLYSPAEHRNLDNPGRDLVEAAGVDMSMSGLAFDVRKSLDAGKQLMVMVESPGGGAAERLLTEVKWCRQIGNGLYRVGTAIISSEAMTMLETDADVETEPISAGPEAPSEAQFQCPACHHAATFVLIGVQKVAWAQGIVPIYDCSKCGTSRTITSILSYNRQRMHSGKKQGIM